MTTSIVITDKRLQSDSVIKKPTVWNEMRLGRDKIGDASHREEVTTSQSLLRRTWILRLCLRLTTERYCVKNPNLLQRTCKKAQKTGQPGNGSYPAKRYVTSWQTPFCACVRLSYQNKNHPCAKTSDDSNRKSAAVNTVLCVNLLAAQAMAIARFISGTIATRPAWNTKPTYVWNGLHVSVDECR
jgi:hypothetical protein